MKILYISNGIGADYLCDMMFHGFRSLFGSDCVDVNKIDFMYQGTPCPPFFTVYGNLPEIEVDRTDIENKIRNRFFDLVVYGSIQRCQSALDLVRSVYPTNKIVFLDGEDDHVISPYRGQGIYFKRELAVSDADLLPIGFCIPKEKILEVIPGKKSRLMSLLDPRDRSTYIYYGSEEIYYHQYSESYFGRTMKKGGWDCCRHYEIMAAGCLPYFERLEECPGRTMTFLPKTQLFNARALCDNWVSDDHWQFIMSAVNKHLKEHLTTEEMAKSILERAQ